MTQDESPANDGWLYMARRLSELEGYARTGLIEPGADQPPVAWWVPDELLTDNPTLTVRALARRGIAAKADPDACGGVYRIIVDIGDELCGPLLAADLDRILGDEGFVGVNHVLTLAPVPKIGPGNDPEPAKQPEQTCEPVDWPDDWQIGVVDTGLFRTAPRYLDGHPESEWELVDFDGGGVVDFSGTAHGGFIAGIFHRMLGIAPIVRDVGTRDYSDWTFAITEADIIADVERLLLDKRIKVINLSLGTYEKATDLRALRTKAEHWVKWRPDVLFVCAAGNDSTELPFYPAGFAAEERFADQFVSVGALASSPDAPDPAAGKADFTNHGDWVTAWAPGVDHCSEYPSDVVYIYGPDQATTDPSLIAAFTEGFAKWSGTSFAAPYAAAEITRFALANEMTPLEAWRKLRADSPVRFPLEGGPCHDGGCDGAD